MTHSLLKTLYLYGAKYPGSSYTETFVISEKTLPEEHLFKILATCTDSNRIDQLIREMNLIRHSADDRSRNIVILDTTKECLFCGMLSDYLVANIGNAIDGFKTNESTYEIVYQTINADETDNEDEFVEMGERMEFRVTMIEEGESGMHGMREDVCDIIVKREDMELWMCMTEEGLEPDLGFPLLTEDWWDDWHIQNNLLGIEDADGSAKLDERFETLLLHLIKEYPNESTLYQIMDFYRVCICDVGRMKRRIGAVEKRSINWMVVEIIGDVWRVKRRKGAVENRRTTWTVVEMADLYRYKEKQSLFKRAMTCRRFRMLPMDIKRMLMRKTVEKTHWAHEHGHLIDTEMVGNYSVELHILRNVDGDFELLDAS
jgi:hypothetical protein